MLKKNEIIRLEISGMTNEGNGVGKHAVSYTHLTLPTN